MATAEGYEKGYEAARTDAVEAIRKGRGDTATGHDMAKIIDGVLWAAEERVRSMRGARLKERSRTSTTAT